MRKVLTGLLTVLLVGILSAVVVAAVAPSGGDPAPAATTTTTPDDSQARKPAMRDRVRRSDDDSREAGEDISGPCDEAEHVNDPRCTGAPAQPSRRVDNSGPGSLNSGPGSVNSGRGSGVGDARDDDHSGSGRGGSGSGGGGDDSGDGGHGGSGSG